LRIGRSSGAADHLAPRAPPDTDGESGDACHSSGEAYRLDLRDPDPLTCPVLAVGAQAYLGDAVSKQLAQVARDVRGVVIPASGHNIALENPGALTRAYLDFFAGG
jgi:pimeloyl-ACP methyl ester carboxylesterase